MPLPGGDDVILALTESGAVVEIPPPRPNAKATPSGNRRIAAKPKNALQKSRASNGDSSLGSCPLCGSEVVEQKQSYRCGNWRTGCPVTVWKTIGHKRLTPQMAKTLLKKGRTPILKGFKSKAGKAFSARLKFVDGEVRLDFES